MVLYIKRIKKYSNIIFVEECYKIGGIGCYLESILFSAKFHGNFVHLSIDNTFIKHSTQQEAKSFCNIDVKSISDAIGKVV